MLPVMDEEVIASSRRDFSIYLWIYLSVEFIIGIVISGSLIILGIIKLFLPKSPRDLSGDVVLIVGASSTLGESLAEEFVKDGCSVICVDNNLRSVEEITVRLRSRCGMLEGVGPNYRKHKSENGGPTIIAYECNLLDRDAIREIAKKVEDEVGGIDVLVTCAGQLNQDIFDMASTTLMIHYWTMLAFLPSLLRRDKAYIVGVTQVASSQDVYLNSRAALASLMENLCKELSNNSSHLTYLTITPMANHGLVRQRELQVAKEVVKAVSRDHINSTIANMMNQISCVIHSAVTTVTAWVDTVMQLFFSNPVPVFNT